MGKDVLKFLKAVIERSRNGNLDLLLERSKFFGEEQVVGGRASVDKGIFFAKNEESRGILQDDSSTPDQKLQNPLLATSTER